MLKTHLQTHLVYTSPQSKLQLQLYDVTGGTLPEVGGEAKPPDAAGVPNGATPKPPEGAAGATAAEEAEEGFPKLRPLPKGEAAVPDAA